MLHCNKINATPVIDLYDDSLSSLSTPMDFITTSRAVSGTAARFRASFSNTKDMFL